MSKINFNTENPEIEITRAIGKKSDGKITLNTEGGSIEIDLGFASLGATTDYGGAVSVGLLGQEITWGREGGTIHIGIGGFAVDVEARDCIVTEVKSIFGIIVAQRSYPDPGCGPPEPFVPPEPIMPDLPPGSDGTEKLNFLEFAWVCLNCQSNWTSYEISGNGTQTNKAGTEETKSRVKAGSPGLTPELALDVKNHFETTSRYTFERVHGDGNNNLTGSAVVTYKGIVANRIRGTADLSFWNFQNIDAVTILTPPNYSYNISGPGISPFVLYGTGVNIAAFIKSKNSSPEHNVNEHHFAGGTIATHRYSVGVIVKQKQPVTAPLLPTGNKPPMQNCCEDILDMLEDIKEAYAVDRLLKDGFPVSNTFMAPQCVPGTVTKAKNMYEIIQCVIRMMAHGMIFEPGVNVKDADAAKAGDQEFKAKYLNATGWASAVAEALLEVKDDGNVSTNMDIRNSFAVTQTMVGLADAIYKLGALIDMMGVEVIPKVRTVETPFNLQIQIGKGFGDNNERQIDLKTDEATEALLPELLKVKTNKIKTVDIHPRSRSLKEILESIEANLPINNNG